METARTLGCTGGIGSGKSYVSNIFAQLGYPVYYSDDRAKLLYDTDSVLLQQMVELLGEDTAQIMLVMGTNYAGGDHGGYLDNLTVASHLQTRLNSLYPGLARPINLRSATFNQQLSTGAMLLEVGSDGNTLEEALRAVRLFGRAFAQMVLMGK
jgi:stage II sporulation protein P